jgi:hypothetical protein
MKKNWSICKQEAHAAELAGYANNAQRELGSVAIHQHNPTCASASKQLGAALAPAAHATTNTP